MGYNADTHTLNIIREHPGSTTKDLLQYFKDGRHYNTVCSSVKRLTARGEIFKRGYRIFPKDFDDEMPPTPEQKALSTIKAPHVFPAVEKDDDTRNFFRDIIAVGRFIAGNPPDTKMPGVEQTVAEFTDRIAKKFNAINSDEMDRIIRLLLLMQILYDPTYFKLFLSVDSQPTQEDYKAIFETFEPLN